MALSDSGLIDITIMLSLSSPPRSAPASDVAKISTTVALIKVRHIPFEHSMIDHA